MSTRESTVSPPEALLNVLVGFWMGRAVYIAAKLGIADLVKDGAKSVEAFKQGEKAFFIYGFARH
jgi:hypothetical protein